MKKKKSERFGLFANKVLNMKSTGITRRVDELGRIVIPKELRRDLNITTKDYLEIFRDEDSIVLRKYSAGCIFCGNMDDVVEYEGKIICRECARKIASK